MAGAFSCSLDKVCKCGQLWCFFTPLLRVLPFCSQPKADVGIEKAPSYCTAEAIFPAAFLKQESKPYTLHSLATNLKRARMQFTQRTVFVHLVLMAKGAGIPEFFDTMSIKEKKKILGRPPSTGHCESSTVKHNQVFQTIRFVYLPSCWRGVSRLPSHVEAKEVLPENKLRKTSSLCTSLVCYSSELVPWPEDFLILQLLPRWHLHYLLAWRPAGIRIEASLDCFYLQMLTAASWRSRIQSAWN